MCIGDRCAWQVPVVPKKIRDAFVNFGIHFLGHPFGALKTATVAQLQGARCDGMAHAMSTFVQRHRPQAGRRSVFQVNSGRDFIATGEVLGEGVEIGDGRFPDFG